LGVVRWVKGQRSQFREEKGEPRLAKIFLPSDDLQGVTKGAAGGVLLHHKSLIVGRDFWGKAEKESRDGCGRRQQMKEREGNGVSTIGKYFLMQSRTGERGEGGGGKAGRGKDQYSLGKKREAGEA